MRHVLSSWGRRTAGLTAKVTRAPARSIALLLIWGAFLNGCAGPSFDGKVYHAGDLHFRVGPIPAAWRQLAAEDTLLAFRDDTSAATIAVNGRCGKDASDVPLAALTQHLFLQFSEQVIHEQALLNMDGREAMKSDVSAKLDGVTKHFLVVVLKKDSCVYDFLRIGHSRADAASREQFFDFVAGFNTID